MSTSLANIKNWPSSRQLRGHRDKIFSLDWSCDGKRLASGSADKTLRIWTPERTEYGKSTELKGHTGGVDQLRWDPANPERLVTASTDSTVRFWDIRQGKATQTIQTTGQNINLTISPDGKYVVIGDRKDVITFIDAGSGKVVEELSGRPLAPRGIEINEFKFSNSGEFLFILLGDGTIRTYEVPSLELYHRVVAHPAPCFCVDVDPRGRYIAVGSTDAIVSLWDLKDWYCARTFTKLDSPVRSVGFSADGELLASGGEDLKIDLSHVETGQSLHSIPTPAPCNSLSWHPTRSILAYAVDEPYGIVRLFGL